MHINLSYPVVLGGLLVLAFIFRRKSERLIIVVIGAAYIVFGSPNTVGLAQLAGFAVDHAIASFAIMVVVIFGICFPDFLFTFGKAFKESKGNERGRAYVQEAIRRAPGFGAGHGPLDHAWPLRNSSGSVEDGPE